MSLAELTNEPIEKRLVEILIEYKNKHNIELREKIGRDSDLHCNSMKIQDKFVRTFTEFRANFKEVDNYQVQELIAKLLPISAELIDTMLDYKENQFGVYIIERKITDIIKRHYFPISNFLNLYGRISAD